MGSVILLVTSVLLAPPGGAAVGTAGLPMVDPTVMSDAQAAALFGSSGVQGAPPLATDVTIPHWQGQYTDPTNGVAYRYYMAGSDPAANLDTTINVDIVPVNVVFPGFNNFELKATDILPAVLNSPIFQATDFSTTPVVTSAADASGTVSRIPGGELSAGNVGVQYEDAIMRAQFNKIGSGYHLRFVPHVYPTQMATITSGNGFLRQSHGGVAYGGFHDGGFLENALAQSHLDPTHLWMVVTNNVFTGGSKTCCALGFHTAARDMGRGWAGTKSQGASHTLPTWMFVSYVQPGTLNPAAEPFGSDVMVFGHEISEWADDPYATNIVDPWLSNLPPQNGCYRIFESGDAVDTIGFTLPGNTTASGPYADGYWHLQDINFLPWVERQAPNTTSQPTQAPSTDIGRYSFMGDLNPYPYFRSPPQSC